MPDGDPKSLKPKVVALQRNTAALLKLLGGDSEDKLRFWEILKGITTPAELLLVDQSLVAMQNLVTQTAALAKSAEKAATQVARQAPKAKAKAAGAR